MLVGPKALSHFGAAASRVIVSLFSHDIRLDVGKHVSHQRGTATRLVEDEPRRFVHGHSTVRQYPLDSV